MSDERAAERKVTFGEVFAIGEYRALFASTQLAWIGEYMAKAAVMALVFAQTGSVAMSAAAFAISYAPWLVGGPFLAALAERYRYRSVMITCDLLRAGLIGLVALPGLPLPVLLSLVFLVALAAPPGQAARSAVLPLVLPGERVVMGMAINQSSSQATQVVGYFAGAVIAIVDPRMALMITASTFILSAIILRTSLRDRAPQMRTEHRSHLLRETGEGFKVVFGTHALRLIAVMVFVSVLFSIVPEGLAIGWASELAEGEQTRQGFYQGLIMIANPIGYAIGVLLIARMLGPTVRRRLVPYLAVLGPLALVPSLANPQILAVVAMTLLSGLALAGMSPTLNGIFVQALPNGFRARAFGVMNSGMQSLQGLAILATGLLVGWVGSERLHLVVGFWCLAGTLIMLLIAVRWPKPEFFGAAIAQAEAANRAASAADPTPPDPEATGAPATSAPATPAATSAPATPAATSAPATPAATGAPQAAAVPPQSSSTTAERSTAAEAGTMER